MLISVQRTTSKPILVLLRRTGGPTPPVHFSSVGLLFFLDQIPPTSMLLHSQRSIFLSMTVSESRVPSFLPCSPHSLNHWQFLDCQPCWELQCLHIHCGFPYISASFFFFLSFFSALNMSLVEEDLRDVDDDYLNDTINPKRCMLILKKLGTFIVRPKSFFEIWLGELS